MATISDDGIVTLNRGDYFKFPLFINTGSELHPIRYSLKDHIGCKLFLGLMEPNQAFENSILWKEYDINTSFIEDENNFTEEGDLYIVFKGCDTINLHPGKYYYEVKLKDENKNIDTIITKTELFLL